LQKPDKHTALAIFNAAVKAVQPSVLIPAHLQLKDDVLLIDGKNMPLKEYDGVYVLSVGKAASAMALEAEKILGTHIAAGLVVTKYEHSLPLRYCQTIEAGHPVPDENSWLAAINILSFLQPLTQHSLLLCFISGGASALIADVADGITLHDLQTLSTLLLQCGADIHEINTVRKHISYLKGGQLVNLAKGAAVFTFIISDVQGDDMSIIASGLTVADPSTFIDAWSVLEKYALVDRVSEAIIMRLQNGINNLIETPKPGSPAFAKVRNYIIGNNQVALNAAALQATLLGLTVLQVDDLLNGEARDAAVKFIQLILNYKGNKPACILAGGETTVTIKGNGKGGRNQEFVLASLIELMKLDMLETDFPVILSGGTDGTDGPTTAAGAVIDIDIFTNIIKTAKNPLKHLLNNDSFSFFEPLNALIDTGATQTNVMDILIAII